MRIISGLYKNRKIDQVNLSTTRETQDRIRLAIFNMLFDIREKRCLDLFSGSGAMGLEAISNGAKFNIFNDIEKKAVETIKNNIQKLTILKDKYLIFNKDYKELIEFLKVKNEKLDIIFIDPPYDFINYDQIINQLIPILNNNFKIVIELDKKNTITSSYFKIAKEKVYGYKKVLILEKGD